MHPFFIYPEVAKYQGGVIFRLTNAAPAGATPILPPRYLKLSIICRNFTKSLYGVMDN